MPSVPGIKTPLFVVLRLGRHQLLLVAIPRVYLQVPRGFALRTVLFMLMFFPKEDTPIRTSMYLLVRHLESIKEFLALVQALWQNVAHQKQGANHGQHLIEAFLTQV